MEVTFCLTYSMCLHVLLNQIQLNPAKDQGLEPRFSDSLVWTASANYEPG